MVWDFTTQSSMQAWPAPHRMKTAYSGIFVGVPKAFFGASGARPLEYTSATRRQTLLASGVLARHLLGHGPMQALPSRVMATPHGRLQIMGGRRHPHDVLRPWRRS